MGNKKTELSRKLVLQNIIFGMNERKLMVSPEFLDKALKGYISKRMSIVNKYISCMSATRSPRKYFTYCDEVDGALAELVVLEPFHTYKKPKPSEFLKILADKREHNINAMLHRAWKHLLSRATTTNGVPDKPAPFEELLDEMMLYKDKFTQTNLTTIELYENSLRRNDKSAEETDGEETDEGGEVQDNAENE